MSSASNARFRVYADPNSSANFNRYRIFHTSFDWTIDFDRRVVHGHVQLDFRSIALPVDQSSHELILDARHLHIERIFCTSTEVPLNLSFITNVEKDSLTIDTTPIPTNTDPISLVIHYSTSPDHCQALQWLTKEQTADGQQPYLFSQCQPILARSLYPCQDSPGVKSTYTARVTAPKPMTVLMSAIATRHEPESNTFFFEQPIAVPSYLIALAVGHLSSYDFSDRIRVWSEPSLLDACKYEFEDVEHVLSTAENLLGEYQWQRYDFLVLPPSLPYGGMENPCMNFISPTILAGDRSLVGLLVHELIHSWIGNLVTNENWDHFWLNEGITSFIETKLLGKLAGDDHSNEVRRFYAAQQWEEMTTDIHDWGVTHPYTCLVYRLNGTNPDDAYSSVQYFKGAALLWHLEQDIVRSESDFEAFLREYIAAFSHRTLNTDEFIQYFESRFPHVDKVDWPAWLHTPGMPPQTLDFTTDLERQCRQLANHYASITHAQMRALSVNQVAYLLNLLLNKTSTRITLDGVRHLDEQCRMKEYTNCEIAYRWYQLCIRVKYAHVLDDIFAFLGRTGRMKYLKVLYSEFKTSWPEVLADVRAFFDAHRPAMHPIAIQQIEMRL